MDRFTMFDQIDRTTGRRSPRNRNIGLVPVAQGPSSPSAGTSSLELKGSEVEEQAASEMLEVSSLMPSGNLATLQKVRSRLLRLPQELLLAILGYSDRGSCYAMRMSCKVLNTTFMCFAWRYLQESLNLNTPTFHPLLTLGELQKQRARKRQELSNPPPVVVPMTPPRNVFRPPLSPMVEGTEIDDMIGGNAVPPSPMDDDEESFLRRLRAPKPPSSFGSTEEEKRLRNVWLAELCVHRNVSHNVQAAQFNYTTIEKQSHAEPLILPNGIICFTRWQLIAVYVRVQEGLTYDSNGNAEYPTGPESYNQNRWIKAGYLQAHADTITSMKYHRNTNTMLTSSFDGTIKRWSIRDDFAPKEDRDQGEIFGLLQTYEPTDDRTFIFSFDVMDLHPPWMPDGDDAFRISPSLLAVGTETGVILLFLMDMGSGQPLQLLGTHNTQDSRIRDIKFLNRHVFTEDFNEEGIQNGEVHLVATTMSNTYLLGQNLSRQRIPKGGDGVRINELADYGYVYTRAAETLTMLTPQVPFADIPSSMDIPQLFWPFPSEVDRYTVPAESQTRTSFSNVPWLPPYKNADGHVVDPETNAFHAYRGNPYLTNPTIIFTFPESSCALACLNVNNPPGDGVAVTNSTALPYRWDALSMDTYRTTCAKWSADHALLAVGTAGGHVRLLVTRPSLSKRRAQRGQDSVNGSSEVAEAVETASDVVERGSDNSFGAMTDGTSLLRSLTPTLGYYSNKDAFIAQLLKVWAAARGASTDAHEEDASGFSCLTLSPSHVVPVVNLTLFGFYVASIDNHSNTHVYDIRTLTLLWQVTQYRDVPKPPSQRRTFIERIIALDAASHIQTSRHIAFQSGTMLITPIAVTNHSFIADFTPRFFDYELMTNEANGSTKALFKRKNDPKAIVSTVDEMVPRKDRVIGKPVCVRAQPSLFSFHLAYVIFPPFALLLLIIEVLFLCLALDKLVNIPYLAIVLFGEVFGLLPYFGGDVYCYKPMIVHVSGLSFACRLAADIAYLVLFPLAYALKMDGYYPFSDLSWIILSSPIQLSLFLAVFAAILETAYDVKHNIVLWRATVNKQRLQRGITDFCIISLASAFVVMMSAYFDGEPVPGKPYSSYAVEFLRLETQVFVPVWALLFYGWMFIPRVLNFNPDPQRLCRSWMSYLGSLFVLWSLYNAMLTLPMVGFALKYNNYYDWVRYHPSNGTTPALPPFSGPFLRNNTLPAGAAVTRDAAPLSSTIPIAANLSLTAIMSPALFFLLLIQIMATANTVVHYKQLVRHAHMLPAIPQNPPQNQQPAAAAPPAAPAVP